MTTRTSHKETTHMDSTYPNIAQFDNHIEALDTQYTSIDDEKVQTISTIKRSTMRNSTVLPAASAM